MPRIRTLILLFGDIAVLCLVFFATAWAIASWGNVWDLDFALFMAEDRTLPGTSIVVGTIVLGLYFLGRYDNVRVKSRMSLLEDLIMLFGVSFLIQAILSYARINLEMSRRLMLTASPIAAVSMVLWRTQYSAMQLQIFGRQRVLFLGDTPVARSLASFIEDHPERGYTLAGPILAGGDEMGLAHFEQRIGTLLPDRIAVSGSIAPEGPLAALLLACSMRGLSVESIGDLYEDLFHRVSLETISINQLIFSPAFRPRPWVAVLQEVYGRALAIAGLILAAPVMLLTILAVRLDSPGPALLRQVRLGKGGVPFTLLKFRSMFVNADAISGPVRAQENDPRITRVGRWIRLTRLDELPQLINVLWGEMALAGPRPEMPELEKKLLEQIPLYPQRHRVKPGITGWAQIHHEPEDSIASTVRKLEYDLFYIKNLSPALDFLTMFHTIKAVLFRIGAR